MRARSVCVCRCFYIGTGRRTKYHIPKFAEVWPSILDGGLINAGRRSLTAAILLSPPPAPSSSLPTSFYFYHPRISIVRT